MPKEMTIEELQKHINSSTQRLKNYLEQLNNSSSKPLRKRSMIISYWLNDFVKYIKNEDIYQPPNRKYKRGDIVLVNFGYRVGSELGGRHFAIVLDCHNQKNSPIITVVPLSSKKYGYKRGIYSFELEYGIDQLYKEKRERLLKVVSESIIEIDRLNDTSETNSDRFKQLNYLVHSSLDKMYIVNNMDREIKKLKSGTIVSVSQITTISKQRIINPNNNKDSLSGIKIKSADLDTLNNYLNNLYLFKNNA